MSKIFVTVGTTSFDDLIKTLLSDRMLKALNSKGYDHLVLQIGNSTLQPDVNPRHGFVHIEYFRICSSIKHYLQSADLVISHAGAGSILESLDAKKPLIVVANKHLMNNHQLELAEQLYKDGYLQYCTCETLLDTIETMELTTLKPFVYNKSKSIVDLLDRLIGFQ